MTCREPYLTHNNERVACTLDAKHRGRHATDDGANAYIWSKPSDCYSYPVRWLSDLDRTGQSFVAPLYERV